MYEIIVDIMRRVTLYSRNQYRRDSVSYRIEGHSCFHHPQSPSTACSVPSCGCSYNFSFPSDTLDHSSLPPVPESINVVLLTQRQPICWLHCTMQPIRFNTIAFWIHLHLRHQIIELHIFLADLSAVLHWFNSLLESIAVNHA